MRVKYEFEIPDNAYGQPCRSCLFRSAEHNFIYCDIQYNFVACNFFTEMATTLAHDELYSKCPLEVIE